MLPRSESLVTLESRLAQRLLDFDRLLRGRHLSGVDSGPAFHDCPLHSHSRRTRFEIASLGLLIIRISGFVLGLLLELEFRRRQHAVFSGRNFP